MLEDHRCKTVVLSTAQIQWNVSEVLHHCSSFGVSSSGKATNSRGKDIHLGRHIRSTHQTATVDPESCSCCDRPGVAGGSEKTWVREARGLGGPFQPYFFFYAIGEVRYGRPSKEVSWRGERGF